METTPIISSSSTRKHPSISSLSHETSQSLTLFICMISSSRTLTSSMSETCSRSSKLNWVSLSLDTLQSFSLIYLYIMYKFVRGLFYFVCVLC
ncbi:hypothetical protein DY000_02036891 [Brassica cretica]|uniref:Uncharacterized protein n=1 Tax=Brassica cretica TaxID=69181 RepID=A0ABQ7B9I5_BRACR|nr:hypothetical protein DY000_02036891 [Brassica cretica]